MDELSSGEEYDSTSTSNPVFDDDDDLTDVESLPSPVGGLNVDKAKSEGLSSDPLTVGTEGNATVVGSSVYPMNFVAEESLEVKDSLLSEPLNVSAVGPEGNSVVHPDTPFDPLNDESVSLKKAEKKMANKKKHKSMALSAARIPIKKNKKKIAAFSLEKKLAAFSLEKKLVASSLEKKLAAIVDRSIKRELTSFKNEMLIMFKSFSTKVKKSSSSLKSLILRIWKPTCRMSKGYFVPTFYDHLSMAKVVG